MTIHESAWKVKHDDARRAGERDRLLLEARRARVPRRLAGDPATPDRRPAFTRANRLAQLLFRRATA